MVASLHPGDLVSVSNQPGRIIAVVDLFGETYADVFLEPEGPVRRVYVGAIRIRPEPFRMLAEPGAVYETRVHPARFAAQTIAYQLQALLAQPGVSSAATFRITPLPHQILAVDYVLNQLAHGPRCLLAEEVGLGKTIEAALVYEELKLRGQVERILVITPSGLTDQWRDEMQQKFDERFVIYDRAMVEALLAMHGQASNVWHAHERVITSLDFIKPLPIRPDLSATERARREERNQRLFAGLVDAHWDMVVFDEAHKLSKHGDGSETARYKVGAALAPQAPVLLLLTATPHQGDAGRFYHLLQLIDEHRFIDFDDLTPKNVQQVTWRTRKRAAVDVEGARLFKQRITDIYPVERGGAEHAIERDLYDRVTDYVRENYNLALQREDRAFGFLMILFQRLVTSSSRAIERALRKRLDQLRLLQSALAATANNRDANNFDEAEAVDQDAQKVLEELLEKAIVLDPAAVAREISILVDLLDLAQQAARGHDAKIKALLHIVEEVSRRERDPATKFLIFTEFVATQEMIIETLEGLGYTVTGINGAMPLEQRIVARTRFAGDAQFMVSTDAGGEGINLQFCHVIVNYDLPWNPMKLEQRIGRLDRIGQEQDVLVFNLVMGDTVENRVREILEEKLKRIAEQFGEDKLADILSTLQDEFNFDRLYLDAMAQRQTESAELEAVAQQIYERAQRILEQDNLLLPQSQASASEARERLAHVPPERVRALVSGYLAAHGEQLQEYARRPGVYYFDAPGAAGDGGLTASGKTHFADVVFEPARAVDDDALTLLHLSHPFVRQIMAELQSTDVSVARLTVPSQLIPAPGLWAVYMLSLASDSTVIRQHLLSIYLDGSGQRHQQPAEELLKLDPLVFQAGAATSGLPDLGHLRDQLERLAQAIGRERFMADQLAHNERLDRRRELLERSYRAQERALESIGIENIREARRRDLLRRRVDDLARLEGQRTLIPDLQLVQLAWIESEAS